MSRRHLAALGLVVLVSGLPYLAFLARHADQPLPLGRLALHTLGTAVALVTLWLLIGRWVKPPGAAACLVAVGAYLAFNYTNLKRAVFGPDTPYAFAEPAFLIAWTLLVVVAVAIVLRFRAAPALTAIFAAALAATALGPAWRIASHWTGSAAPPPAPPAGALAVPLRPNVYWIVLDAYQRADVLATMFGFDNQAFLDAVRQRDFVIADSSQANYPVTIYSIAATLTMDYVITEESPPAIVNDLARFRTVVQGRNAVASAFRRLGYTYVHWENGYDYLTRCGTEVDVCLRDRHRLDELDYALLSMSPLRLLYDRAAHVAPVLGGGPLRPGAVEALTRQLKARWPLRTPFFLYAHILAPHPPFRFKRDCSPRATDADLQVWDDRDRRAYVEQLQCVNRQTLDFLHLMETVDPEAVVILQSDHGTAFEQQFRTAPAAWTPEQAQERFAVLNAMRVPEPCRARIHPTISPVNTFRLVLACLEQRSPQLLPDVSYIAVHDPSPGGGSVVRLGRAAGRTVTSRPQAGLRLR